MFQVALGQVIWQIIGQVVTFSYIYKKAKGKYQQHKKKEKNNTIVAEAIHTSTKEESSDIWVRWGQLHDHHCVHKHQGT
jgi:hypothetical protein